jgi:hypothetical protein
MIICSSCRREVEAKFRGATALPNGRMYNYCRIECMEKGAKDFTTNENEIISKIMAEIDLGEDTRDIITYIIKRYFEFVGSSDD